MNIDCKSRRGTNITVLILGSALAAILMACIVFGDNNDEQGLKTLRMVSILFRHGERNPEEFYPNDPLAAHDWPGGPGALRPKGALQAYNLGKNLRRRYYRLLPPNVLYSQQEVRVLSSSAERCIKSANAVLAGFMPPLEHNNLLPIEWQPVPVYYIPKDQDPLLFQEKPCKKYDKLIRKLNKYPPKDLRKLYENDDLLQLLSKYTGKNISTPVHVEELYDTLKTESEAGLVLPDWTENIYPERLTPIVKRSYRLYTETSLMKKVKGGALLSEIHTNMVNKSNGNLDPDRNIFLYSGHDVTLVNIMHSLNILDQTSNLPDYASAIVFELHDSSLLRDDFEVKIVYYYNSDDKFPKELDIPNCDAPCSLTEFTTSISHLLLDNYHETCGNSAKSVCNC